MPKVTVFMPVYNSENYLRKAIDSILTQTFADFELLIIDDGSTDSSLEIIKSYEDSRIQVFQNEVNKGLPYTRNRGLSLATGDYVALMDSDDIADKTRLEEQVNYLDQHQEIHIVTSDETIIFKDMPVRNVKRIDSDAYIKMFLLFDNYIGNPTVMFRQEIAKKFKYNEDCFVCQDYEFWVQLKEHYNFGSVTKSLLKYRTGHENITKKSNVKRRERRNELLSEIRKRSLSQHHVHLTEEELTTLTNWLDYKNTQLAKFEGILPVLLNVSECIKKQYPHYKNEIEAVINELTMKQLVLCQGRLKEKLNLYDVITKTLPFVKTRSNKAFIIKKQAYLFIKNKLV